MLRQHIDDALARALATDAIALVQALLKRSGFHHFQDAHEAAVVAAVADATRTSAAKSTTSSAHPQPSR